MLSGTLGGIVLSAPAAGAAVPATFVDQLVTAVTAPTAMDFTPDGRLLIATQPGLLRVVQDGALLPAPAIDLTPKLCGNSERGLLGVAVDPLFTSNQFVFVYYSFNKAGDCGVNTVNRVSRFVMSGNTLSGETVLIDNIPSPAGNHNGGDLEFGKDGFLYVSVGDGGCDYPGGTPSGCGAANDASRDQNTLVGKILRIDKNGVGPPGNPFKATGAVCAAGGTTAGGTCQETFASGLRNPFRMAFDPNAAGTRFYVNDVGQATWEEIDQGTAGADYGWNVREGHCATGSTTNCGTPPAGMTNPIFDYGRSDGCVTITGGAFVPNGVWPSDYDGKYLFADYGCGKIFRLDPDGSGGFNRVDVVTNLGSGSAVDLTFGPWKGTKALYYSSYAGGGQIRRISRTVGTSDDYNGDGTTDIGVYRPSTGQWLLRGQSGGAWGTSGDVPVPGDYNADGRTDLAVWRPSTGTWYVQGISTTVWGASGDIPVPGDYNGDGKTDPAVWRPSTGTWYVRGQSGGAWGASGDVPVPGDYNGDGKTDLAVFRPSNGAWYVRGQSDTTWGVSGDVPVPGDYNGDGRADLAVWRPSTGTWYLRGVGDTTWGVASDTPLTSPS